MRRVRRSIRHEALPEAAHGQQAQRQEERQLDDVRDLRQGAFEEVRAAVPHAHPHSGEALLLPEVPIHLQVRSIVD